MKILAIDQSRDGGWATFDYETKQLLSYGEFNFSDRKYTYPMAIYEIGRLVEQLVKEHDVSAVFIEEISYQRNQLVFKRLAQLQGVLENYFIRNNILYDIIQPTVWQRFAKTRKRTKKEIEHNITSVNTAGKKETKVLSIQFAKEVYGLETTNDGIADAVGIGHFAVHKKQITNKGVV